MQVILLEKVRNLGDIGEKVNVKAGYGRNFLIPQSKAMSATKNNILRFESRRAELEKNAALALAAAQERAKALGNITLTIPSQTTGDEGKLFGSVGMREIIHALKALGHNVDKREVSLPKGAIKQVGEYAVDLLLHSDVTVPVKLKIVPIAAEEISK